MMHERRQHLRTPDAKVKERELLFQFLEKVSLAFRRMIHELGLAVLCHMVFTSAFTNEFSRSDETA
jgi:hypothetical protein